VIHDTNTQEVVEEEVDNEGRRRWIRRGGGGYSLSTTQ
jgi:hypothetical protein